MEYLALGDTGAQLVYKFNKNFEDGISIPVDGLAAAIAAIGAASGKIIVATSQAITSNITVPKNISVIVQKPAMFTVALGQTLTINGPFEAGVYQIFSITSSTQVVFDKGSIEAIRPEWFTENTIAGVIDMTNALKYCVSIYEDIELQRTDYLITDTIILNHGSSIVGKNKYTGSSTITSFDPSTIIFNPSSEKDLFDAHTNGTPYLRNVCLKGFDIIGNTTGGVTNSRYAIYNSTVGGVYENLGIRYFQDALYLGSCISNKYRDISIFNMSHAGIYTEALNYSVSETFDNVWIDSCPWGGILRCGLSLRFINCLFESFTDGGFDIYRGVSGVFSNCYAEDVCGTVAADLNALFYIAHNGVSTSATNIQIIGGVYYGRNFGLLYHGSFMDVETLETPVLSERIKIIGVTFGRFVNGIKVSTLLTEEYTVYIEGSNCYETTNFIVGDTITAYGGYRVYGEIDDTYSGTFNQPVSKTWVSYTKKAILSDGGGLGEITQQGSSFQLLDDDAETFGGYSTGNTGILLVVMSNNDLINESALYSISFSTSLNYPIVKKISGTTNTSDTDTDGNLCVFPGVAGTVIINVRNRLNAVVNVSLYRISNI